MPDTDLHQPSLGSLRAAAEAAELARAVSGLVSADGYRLAGSDPLAPLARDIARSMTEAGLSLHYCARHDPSYRLGGICLLPVPAGPANGHAGIAVSWTTHSLMSLDWDRFGTYTGIQQCPRVDYLAYWTSLASASPLLSSLPCSPPKGCRSPKTSMRAVSSTPPTLTASQPPLAMRSATAVPAASSSVA